jgi:23S rRNA (pseudouridine1915-N3)-methyltransferase
VRITLLCVGKLGRSSESLLAADYAARATATGRALGLGPVEIVEVEGRKSGKAAEAEALLAKLDGAYLIACDEHGSARGSRDFAAQLARLRDDGTRRLAIVIGGADGLDEAVLAKAAERIAFGVQTWPHALVRVMLAEQVYRATTILAGGPYHRD